MSGGSFNYLCYKDFPDICNELEQLGSMRDRLVELDCLDGARETEQIILILQQARIRIEERMRRLSNLWHDVEWYDSNDSSLENVQQGIAEYRSEAKTEGE